MKNIIKISTLLLLSLIFFNISCGSDDSEFIQESNEGILILTPSVSSFELNPNTPDTEVINFTWDDSTGNGAPYNVYMSSTADFENAALMETTDTHYFRATSNQLNMMLNSLGVTPYVGTTLYFKVMTSTHESNIIQYVITVYPDGVPTITTPATGASVSLSEEMAEDVAATLEWSDFDNTSELEITYIAEAALSGTDFASIVEAGSVTSTSAADNMIEWTHAALNTVAISCGINGGETGDIDVRIKSSYTDNVGAEIVRYSDPITLTVTTYNIDYPNLYFVGNATPDGWNPNNNNTPLFRDPNDPSIFQYTGYFNAGAFKLIEVLGQWAPMFGTNDGGATVAYRATEGDPDPGVWEVSTAGYYTFTVDLSGTSGTSTMEAYDAASATTYNTIGLIGSATPNGWDSDQDLTQSSTDPHLWYINGITLVDGEAKFRAEDDWGVNWGSDTPLFGTAVGNGPNIPVTAGTYDVWFNDLDGSYNFIEN